MLTPQQTTAIKSLSAHWKTQATDLVIRYTRAGAVKVETEAHPLLDGYRAVLVRASGTVKPISGCQSWGVA